MDGKRGYKTDAQKLNWPATKQLYNDIEAAILSREHTADWIWHFSNNSLKLLTAARQDLQYELRGGHGLGRLEGQVENSRSSFLSAGKCIHLYWSSSLSMLTHPWNVRFTMFNFAITLHFWI